ncbi:TSUP family transporter [Rothia nasimurium]|uniref:TSUP family transporter n=1 Tax=Rothia nasimurium TaxID=85336 RepID=UPI001F01EC25|nr:TSUP family transporter [Rothia nasimurium]
MLDTLGFDSLGLEPTTLVLLLLAALAAGWVDAVVGGGGMIQLPAVLMVPGLSPVQALAVNKLGSVFGTLTSAATYLRRTPVNVRTVLPAASLAFVTSMGGALVATALPEELFKPIIVLALILVLVYTVFKPSLGELTQLKHRGLKHLMVGLGIGATIGFYDGLLGPGTGSFLMMAMVSLMGYSFLQATAQTKIINAATNLGALVLFAVAGQQVWALGLLLGAANMVGGYLGARTALARGSRFIRWMMIVVVSALIIKLGADILGAL